jgi:hypothetical protein
MATCCAGSATPTSTEPGTIPTTSQTSTVPETRSATTPFSAGQHLRFDRISLEQGLSQSTVYCMLQDSQGFRWFGTDCEDQGGRESPIDFVIRSRLI